MSATNIQFSVAVHMMTALGFHHGEGVHSRMLAASVKTDPSFVRRSLSKLVKAGLVVATRGKHGSCRLARSPEKITLLDIYRACGAPSTLAVHTYPVEDACPISAHIKPCLSGLLEEFQSNFERTLAKKTLADVIVDIQRRMG
jgi:Rrf2 family protein